MIAANHYLQYLLELDASGYIEPICPRTDLSYAEKVVLLRGHTKRWNDPESVIPVCYELPDGYMLEYLNGTVIWAKENEVSTRLYFYQLPSKNRGTSLKHWSFDLDNMYNIVDGDPHQDLMVLLEGGDGQEIAKIHLRTMSTNEPHPRTHQAVLCYVPVTTFERRYFGIRITLFGCLLAGFFVHTSWGQGSTRQDHRIVIWNWMTGYEVTVCLFVIHTTELLIVTLL